MIIDKEEKELQELYALAQEELGDSGESLVVWAGGDTVNQQDAVVNAFVKKFPNIPISLKVDLSKIHDLNIYRDLLNGNLGCDVTMLQTSNDFEDWKNMGVLESFKSASFDQIRDEFKDPKGAFSAFRMFAFLPQYAKEGIGLIPTNSIGLLTDQFRDKLILTYPHDDDAVLYVYDQMVKQYGIELLERLSNLNPSFIRGTGVPPVLVGRKEYLGSITGYETTADMPSQSFIPADDFFISWGQRIAMFKQTKHKACARLFIAFVQSREFQDTLEKYTIRKDVELSEKWIGDYDNTNPVGFYEFMRDRQHIGEFRKTMEEFFGEVKGDSPVEDYSMIKYSYNNFNENWPTKLN